MKLKLLITLIFAGFVSFAFTQECKMYFPADEGTEIEITNYDKKDKVSGTNVQKIIRKEVDGDNLTLGIYQETHDEKGELVGSGEFEIRCEEGTFYVDMRSYLDDKTMSAYEGMELAVETSDMEMPSDMSVGQTLPDASITAVISNQGIKMITMTINITNRTVEAIEDITTPAGTFECYKLTYDIHTKMMFKIEAHAVEWLSEDVGQVRTESYNKKGKLQSYSVLTGLKK